MKTVRKFVTNDNKVFDTEKEAIKYVDGLISQVLFPLADRIYMGNNRTEIAKLIMENIQTFGILIELTKDMTLEDTIVEDSA